MTDNAKASRQEVVEFLRSFKAAMEFGQFHLLDRRKNLQGLVDLGLTIDGMKEVLAQLGVDNYCAGPEPEHDDSSKEVWFFGYNLNEIEVYIKLRLAEVSNWKNPSAAIVWSFHEAEYTLRYPLKG